MKFREFELKSGRKILLGKDAKNNDELVKKFKGKENLILHTSAPGSPFCVIESIDEKKPTEKEIYEAAVICASKSQDWRDNKKDVKLDLFTGKDVKKTIFMKPGSWKIKKKPKVLNAKRKDITSCQKNWTRN